MNDIRIGNIITLPDGDHIVEGLTVGAVRLRHTVTQDVQFLDIAALARLLDHPPLIPRERPRPLAWYLLDKEEIRRVRARARHVQDVIEGRADGPYDANTTATWERFARKMEELSGNSQAVSPATLKRWIKAYKEFGPAGLADRRKTGPVAPLGRLDARLVEVITIVIANQTNRSTKTLTNLIHEVKSEALKLYPPTDLEMPSDRTLRRHIETLSKGKYPTGNAANRRTAANAPKRMFNPRPAIAPGHEVQIDSSPFDVLVLGPNGKPIRAKLTIMLDIATKSILATAITVAGTKGIDLAFMLAQCLLPRAMRPGGPFAMENELTPMPWAQHLTGNELEKADTTRPLIRPQRIMTDNGKEYLSETFRSACQIFGIDLTRSAVRTPTDKASVERAFHTIKTQFVELLPGATGGSVDQRGKNPEKDDLLDLYSFAELFDRWVAVVWQRKPQESLRDPLHPEIVHSPNTMYLAMYDVAGGIPVPISDHDYISLLPTLERTIQLDGIQIDYRRYDALELHRYRLRPSEDSLTNGKWVVHHNPHDPRAVWVQDPEDGEWIECTWMNKDAFNRPFSRTIRRTAREITADLGVLGDEEATRRVEELLGHTKAAQAERQRQLDNAAMNAKLAEQQGRLLPHPTPEVEPDTEDDDADEIEEFGTYDPDKNWGLE